MYLLKTSIRGGKEIVNLAKNSTIFILEFILPYLFYNVVADIYVPGGKFNWLTRYPTVMFIILLCVYYYSNSEK